MLNALAITEVHSADPEYAVVTNLGQSELDISGCVLNAGDEGQDFTFPPGTTLAPGASVKVFTDKANPEPGEFSYDSRRRIWNNSGDVGVLYDSSRQVVSKHSYGSRQEPPVMVVRPATLTFGTAAVGAMGSTQKLTIENRGGSDLLLTGTPVGEITGSDAGDFELVEPPARAIAPGSSTSLTVRFRPTAKGNRAAKLRIEADDPKCSPATVELRGEAVTRAKLAIETSPALKGRVHDFGEVAADGEAKVLQVTVRNIGEADLQITAVALQGATASYRVSGDQAATIAPGGSIVMEVTFDPSSGGDKPGSLSIDYDEGDGPSTLLIGLMGMGTGPEIDVTLAGQAVEQGSFTHDFGDVDVGKASAEARFVITNNGKAPLRLTGSPAVQVCEGADLFEVQTQPGLTELAPGASTELTVVFQGRRSGEHHGYIEIRSNDEDESPYRIDLRGRARRKVAGGARTLAQHSGTTLLTFVACLDDGSVRTRYHGHRSWTRVSGLSNIVSVYGHAEGAAYALDADGRLWAVSNPKTAVLDGGVIDVAVGRTHVLALMEDGRVWARGSQQLFSPCGQGPMRENGFNEVSGVDDVVQVAASRNSSLALRADGTMWHWGHFGRSGDFDAEPSRNWDLNGVSAIYSDTNTYAHDYYFAAKGSTIYFVSYIECYSGCEAFAQARGEIRTYGLGGGDSKGMILLKDGTLWAEGTNSYYQLGVGDWFATVPPSQVPGLPKVRDVLASGENTLAIGEDGRIYEWGLVYMNAPGRQKYAQSPKITL